MYVFVSGAQELDAHTLSSLYTATIAKRQGRLEAAERAYRKWMERSPRDPRPAYGLALMLLARGDYEEGWRLYEARAYIEEAGIAKPVFVLTALPLPPAVADGEWGRQTISLDPEP